MHIHIYILAGCAGLRGDLVMPTKTRATIVIEHGLWKDFKKMAIDRDMHISELLEEIVHSYVKGKPCPDSV